MAINDTLLIFDALANQPPTSGFATLDVRGDLLVLDFDASADEQAQFIAKVPSHYKGGDLELEVTWTSTAATTGNAKLRVELTRVAAGDNLDSLPAVAATGSITLVAPAASGVLTASSFAALAVADLVAGDFLRVQMTRLATDGADTMAGDVELVCVEVKEGA
jgi:hypothetical protein